MKTIAEMEAIMIGDETLKTHREMMNKEQFERFIEWCYQANILTMFETCVYSQHYNIYEEEKCNGYIREE